MTIFTLPQLRDGQRWKNMRVGLLGGSFNPPHEGHVHISVEALKALELDAVWWLVTPQNPIKSDKPMPLEERVRLSREVITHPKILVTDIEKELNTTVTYETVRKLKGHYPGTQFVWISGMDNALNLHKWHRWQDLLKEICMVHLTRMPAKSLIKGSPLRMLKGQKHVVINKAGQYPLESGITYWMLQKSMVDISSSEIREKIVEKSAT